MSSDYDLAHQALSSRKPTMSLLQGPPGAGKTHAAIAAALENKSIKKIVIIRKPQSFGDSGYGFLPGELENKIEPWVKHICEIVHNLGYNPNELRARGKLVFPSFEHVCGSTYDDSFIIIDEAQSCTFEELYVLCSRVGRYSWLVLTGDSKQVGSNFKPRGWLQLQDHIHASKLQSMQIITFDDGVNYRSPLCKDIVDLFAA